MELIRRFIQLRVAAICAGDNLLDTFVLADRILLLRRHRAAGERWPQAHIHGEVVKLAIGSQGYISSRSSKSSGWW
jgi:hypothetical protein